jgi:hypothetical protein
MKRSRRRVKQRNVGKNTRALSSVKDAYGDARSARIAIRKAVSLNLESYLVKTLSKADSHLVLALNELEAANDRLREILGRLKY